MKGRKNMTDVLSVFSAVWEGTAEGIAWPSVAPCISMFALPLQEEGQAGARTTVCLAVCRHRAREVAHHFAKLQSCFSVKGYGTDFDFFFLDFFPPFSFLSPSSLGWDKGLI